VSKPANPFEIDPNRLHEEWVSQAGHCRDAGRREADARHHHAQVKTRFEVIQATIKSRIRRNPSEFDIEGKPTIDQIDTAMTMQKEYLDAQEELHLAKRDLDYATADTTAFIDRRKGLEGLVQLLQLNYYSEREPFTASEEMKESITSRRRKAIRGNVDVTE